MTNLQLIQAVWWNCSPWTEGFRTRGLREDNPRSKKNQSGTLLTTSSWHPCTLTFLGSCEKTACENDSRPGRGCLEDVSHGQRSYKNRAGQPSESRKATCDSMRIPTFSPRKYTADQAVRREWKNEKNVQTK